MLADGPGVPIGRGRAGPQPGEGASAREHASDRRAGLSAVSGAIRVLVAKPGLDGHDRGAKIVARALRDAGMEVVYTGLHQTPEQIVEAALQEDVQCVGLSIHSGAHMTLFPRVVELLEERDAGDIVVFGGGIIPKEDIAQLQAAGVAAIFTPGARMTEIVEWVRDHVRPRD
jgi:methylmalonyl-CoA mutase, C-terminal domain